MPVVLIIISAVLLCIIINFAVSSKSSRLLKRVALIALILIGLSLGICGIIIIRGPGEKPPDIPFPVSQGSSQQPAENNSIMENLGFFAAFLVILGVIIVIALRDHRRQAMMPKQAVKSPVLPASKKVSTQEQDNAVLDKEKPAEDEEDSFDLNIK